MKNALGILAALALMGGGSSNNSDLRPEDIDVTPKIPPVPKGCKRFYFNKEGECNEQRAEIYFDAMNKPNAVKKFNRWKSK